MAKKRSKKDRIRAKLRHSIAAKEPHKESPKELKIQTVEAEKPTEKIDYLKEIFAYDPKLILGDLRKTLLVVLFVLIVLLAIFLLYT